MANAVPRRVVFFGVSRSGKSTLGEGLRARYGHHVTAFADPLKHAAKAVFDFRDEDLWGPSHTRETPYQQFEFSGWCFECHAQCMGPERFLPLFELGDDEKISKVRGLHAADADYWSCGGCGASYPKYVTPREALKTLGTAWGRRFCKDVWAASCFQQMSGNERYAVTDGRFWNELTQATKHNSCTVLLKRGLAESTSPHPSEAEVREMALELGSFDLVLNNVECSAEANLDKLLLGFDSLYENMLRNDDHRAGNIEWMGVHPYTYPSRP